MTKRGKPRGINPTICNKLIRQAFGILRSGLAFDATFVEKSLSGGAKNT